jgi:HEAT repeat protein
MKTVVLLTGLVVLVASIIVASEWKSDLSVYVERLRSEDIAVRNTAADAILERRQEALKSAAIIQGIEKIVVEFADNESRKGTARTAIDLLGNLQSSRSVPVLVQQLTFHSFYKDTKRPQPRDDYFPSVGALIKIGEPSLNPVLDRAERSDDDEVARSAAFVVKGILKGEAASFLQQRAANQTDSKASQRLALVQKYLGT